MLFITSFVANCQETEKYADTYSITGTFEVIDGPMYGYKGPIDSTTTFVKSYGSQIALLNFLGADSVMANVKQDSFYVIDRRIDYGDCTGYISGSGRFSGDSIYYSSIMGGCGIEGIIEFTCFGKKLTTNVAEITSGQNKIKCYPNPFTNVVTIEIPNAESAVVKILSAEGKLVFKRNFDGRSYLKADLSAFPAGIYFVKVKASDKVMVQKILKQ